MVGEIPFCPFRSRDIAQIYFLFSLYDSFACHLQNVVTKMPLAPFPVGFSKPETVNIVLLNLEISVMALLL